MMIDLSDIVRTMYPEAVRDPRLTSLTADLGTKWIKVPKQVVPT